MARVTDDLPGGGAQGSEEKITHLDGHAGGAVKVPSADFVADADIARDGQDLVLTAPDGSVVVIDGYFLADPAPMITAPDGTALTPQLVESFVHGAGPAQFAQAGTMADVTPVGAVHEVHGKATVTHPDGTTENIVLGTAIYQGDIVETEGDAAVEIGFVDESSFAVSSNARLAIDEFVFDSSSQGGESNFSMLRGMFVYTSGLIGREDPDDVKIGTPVGSIGIRGTTIAGNVDTGEITVVEGAIVLRGLNGNEVTLASEFGTARFTPGGDVLPLPNMNPAELGERFASMNSVAPAFFATIGNADPLPGDDAAAEDGGDGDAPPDAGATPDSSQPATDGAGTPDGGTAEPAPDAGSETMLMDGDVSFDGETADAFGGGTDAFSGTDGGDASFASLSSDNFSFDSDSQPSPSSFDSSQQTVGNTTTTDTTTAPPPPPPVNTNAAISTATMSIAENSGVSAAVGTVATANMTAPVFAETGNGTGAGIFDIDAAGNITVQAAILDFETLASYTYEIQATDVDGTVATRLLTISLSDLDDEAPVLGINNARTLNEGATTSITTAFLDSSDIDTADANLTYTVTNAPANGQLELSTNPGVAVTTFTQADIVAGRLRYVHDSSETTADSFVFDIDDGAGHTVTSNVFNFTVTPQNDVPTMTADTFAVDENSVGGTAVGTIATAADADLDTLTFSETGNGTGAALFQIDGAGNISVTAGAYLDFEGTASYTYEVQVSDGNGGVTATMMTININNLSPETITGNASNNTLTGGVGNDIFLVNDGDGSDTIVGGGQTTADIYDASAATGNMAVTVNASGAGSAINGANTDTFSGIENITTGAGSDSFLVNNINASIAFDAGAGTDLLDFSALGAGNPVTVDMAAGTASISGGTAGTFSNFETLNGSAGADMLTGSSGNNTISGMGGNDTIVGGLGNDTLNGNAGNDTFIVTNFDGGDAIDGGAGIDTYDASAATSNMIFDMLAGTVFDGTNTDTFTGVESFVSSSGISTFTTYNGDGAQTFDNSSGNVTTSGSNYDAQNVTNNLVFDMGTGGTGTVFDGTDTDTVVEVHQFRGGTGINTYIARNDDGDQWFTMDAGGYHIYNASNLTYNMTFDAAANSISAGADTDLINAVNIDEVIGGTGNDIFLLNSDAGLTVDGGAGTDVLRFTATGTYDTANLGGVTGIETIETLTAAVNLALQVNAALFANDTGDLTINLDGNDALDIDFTAFGGGGSFNLVSGNLTSTGIAHFLNSTTGNNIFINYAAGTTTITETGAGGSSVLYLNTLSNADGFTIADDTNTADGFGNSVAALGDVDGDGYDDIGMVKALGIPDNGSVFILPGQAGGYGDISVSAFLTYGYIDSGLFDTTTGTITDDMMVANAGDFNGDGIADYIVGAPQADSGSGSFSGNMQIIDGSTGVMLVELDGLNSMDLTGFSVAGIGDVNGDGFADVVIGAPMTSRDLNDDGDVLDPGESGDFGSAYVLFGADYAPGTVINVNTMDGPSFAGELVDSDGAGPNRPFNADAKDIEIFEGGSAGTVAFVMKNNGQIDVVNIDDPSAPFIHGVSPLTNTYIANLPGYAGDASPLNGLIDIVVKDNFLYILSGSVNSATQGQITVLDITDPVNPTFVDSFVNAALLNATAMDVDLVSGHLVVATSGGYVHHIVSSAIGTIGSTLTDVDGTGSGNVGSLSGASEIVLNGNFAYIVTANDPDGGGAALPGTLQVVDISTPSTLSLGTQINIENIKNIFFDQAANRLYVVSSTGGTGKVWVYDTTSPGSPALLGTSTMNAFLGNATDIVVQGGVAFVTTPGGVQAVDVSVPGSISMIGLLPDGGGATNDGMALALDKDGFLHVVSGGATDTLASINLVPAGQQIDGTTPNDFLGMNVSSAGDFNNDGFKDFIVSSIAGGTGEVAIIYGGSGIEAGINMANAVRFTGIAVTGNNEVPVKAMGDLNGDGISDIGIFAMGANSGDGTLYITFGGGWAPGSSQNAAASADLIISNPGVSIEGAGGTGDFNGDGFDDLAVVMRSGNTADIYVVYGGAALGGTHDLSWLNNAANAFHMTYTIQAGADPNNFSFNISGAGDIDGDGYYDLLIGLPDADNDPATNSDGAGTNLDDSDGSTLVVYGRDTGVENAAGSVVQTSTTANAAANGDVIIGSDSINALGDGGFANVSFHAGAGDDMINLGGGGFNNIDGGGGWDTLNFTGAGSLDFRSFNAEDIRRMEEIDMTSGSATVILSMQNIFSMLGSSDTGMLTISGSATDTLQIDHAGATQAGADQQQIAQLLGADGWAYNGTDLAYDFTFGGYVLQISQNLVDNNNVDVV